ncbi:TPA: hypothetical protein ACF227_003055 [Klebsiella pneumoniae]
MKIANEFNFNEHIGGTQHGFTSAQLDDLIDYVNENRDRNFFMLHHEVPVFDSTYIINIFHPSAPDTFCLYLYQDEDGNWWPYATLDCLTGVKSLLKSIWVH